MEIGELTFDFEDKDLFGVDDLLLKAEAIQHSILPKLEGITNYTISAITDTYGVVPLQDSTVLKYPAFRSKRAANLKTDYNTAEVGLGGKRVKRLWTQVLTKTKQNPSIIPFSLTFRLDSDGLCFYFQTDRYNITLDYNQIYADLFIKSESFINILKNNARIYLKQPYILKNEDFEYQFINVKDYINGQLKDGYFSLIYSSETIKYPITERDIMSLIERFVVFYPVYESCLLVSKGNASKIKERIDMLYSSPFKIKSSGEPISSKSSISNQDILSSLAETKLRVMPALRWQVFQRDNWHCVSCGRGSQDGIILHVDHIVPRSKGGRNHIENYQTLCHLCNIGKSDRDQTDLRK